jgi:hypothetical protein
MLGERSGKMTEHRAGSSRMAALGGELLAALAASLGWSAIVAVRLCGSSPSGWTLLGAFGSSALTLGVALAIWRRARPLSEGAQCFVLGALSSSVVLGVFGAVLRTKTHHRALGAVTFALGAAIVVLFSVVLVARLRQVARSHEPRGHLTRALSLAIVLTAALATGIPLSASTSPLVRSLMVDGVTGGCLFVVAVSLPRWRLPAWAAWASALGWGTVVMVGLLVLGANRAVYVVLAFRAPVALGAAFSAP